MCPAHSCTTFCTTGKYFPVTKPRPGSSANHFASYPGRGSFYTPGVLSIRLFFLFSKQGCQYTEQRESSCGCGGCQWCGIGCFHRFGCLRCCGCFGCRCCGTCRCVVLFGCVGVGRRRGCLVSGGVVDLDKARRIILQDYRNTKLGTITLDQVNEEPYYPEDGEDTQNG